MTLLVAGGNDSHVAANRTRTATPAGDRKGVVGTTQHETKVYGGRIRMAKRTYEVVVETNDHDEEVLERVPGAIAERFSGTAIWVVDVRRTA